MGTPMPREQSFTVTRQPSAASRRAIRATISASPKYARGISGRRGVFGPPARGLGPARVRRSAGGPRKKLVQESFGFLFYYFPALFDIPEVSGRLGGRGRAGARLEMQALAFARAPSRVKQQQEAAREKNKDGRGEGDDRCFGSVCHNYHAGKYPGLSVQLK